MGSNASNEDQSQEISVRLCVLCVSVVDVRHRWHQPSTRFEYTQPHMGTTVRVVLYAPSEPEAGRAAAAAFARIAALDATLSDYRRTANSAA